MATTLFADQKHHHHLYPNNKKTLREIDIPPRKLLHRHHDSPGAGEHHPNIFSKFLPSNNPGDSSDDDSDPYSSDNFRMYEFKVRKCNRSRSHDWTDCPFAHPGEKARRRDPRRFHYTGNMCPEFRKGQCGKGDNCEFAHGVFECWLHPSRYRTEACKDGKNCKRKVCFFAHSSKQLRILPENPPENVYNHHGCNCCVYCHSSPTSTLVRGSPPMSPPISPYAAGYKEAMNELMASFDGMNMNGNCFSSEDNQFSPYVPARSFGSGECRSLFSGDPFGRNVIDSDNSSVGGPDLGWVNDLLT